ncbi:hypothetical protein [Kitasatospora sp. NPDC057541]|uniref:hypothetical protein n=1 Tax=unclassified Kitasatospora TaxID=2633591 RepID=UPI00369B8ADF
MEDDRYVPDLLVRLELAAGGWLTPSSGPLAVRDLLPLIRRARDSTAGPARRSWDVALRVTDAQLWFLGGSELDSDRELWERVHDAVRRAAAEQPLLAG